MSAGRHRRWQPAVPTIGGEKDRLRTSAMGRAAASSSPGPLHGDAQDRDRPVHIGHQQGVTILPGDHLGAIRRPPEVAVAAQWGMVKVLIVGAIGVHDGDLVWAAGRRRADVRDPGIVGGPYRPHAGSVPGRRSRRYRCHRRPPRDVGQTAGQLGVVGDPLAIRAPLRVGVGPVILGGCPIEQPLDRSRRLRSRSGLVGSSCRPCSHRRSGRR